MTTMQVYADEDDMMAADRGLGKAGFTLVEMLVAVAISGILVIAIYTAYVIQQKSFVVQEQVAETQQNLRAAMIRLLSEIRQAGCDPTGTAGAGIAQATAIRFQFTADIGGNAANPNMADGIIGAPATNENITFGMSAANDANGNGIADGGVAGGDWRVPGSLGRDTGGGLQPAAELIDAVEFNYILADDTSTNGSGVATATQANAAISNPGDIRAVQVSLLARGARPDPEGKFFDNATYTTAAGTVWIPGDTNGDGVREVQDNFRRRFVIVTIQLRNMGL